MRERRQSRQQDGYPANEQICNAGTSLLRIWFKSLVKTICCSIWSLVITVTERGSLFRGSVIQLSDAKLLGVLLDSEFSVFLVESAKTLSDRWVDDKKNVCSLLLAESGIVNAQIVSIASVKTATTRQKPENSCQYFTISLQKLCNRILILKQIGNVYQLMR